MHYEGIEDFVLAAPLATMPYVLMVNVALPADDVRGLIAWLKVRPGEINYGSSGDGSTGHLAGERFRRMTGLHTVHVSYNGGLAALNAVATQHVSYMFAAMPLALPFLTSQYLRPIAVTTAQRTPLLPQLPTLSEEGLAGYHVEGWFGIFAPARTPVRAVAWLSEHISAYLREPAVQSRLQAHGLDPALASREQFATRINSEAREMAVFAQHLQATNAHTP